MTLNVRIVDEVPVTPDPHTMYLVEIDTNTFDIKMTDSVGDVRSLPDAPGGGGAGTVTSVEGIQPDVNGNVDLGLATGAYMEPSLPGEEATGSQLVRGDDPRLFAASIPVGLGAYLTGDEPGWLRADGQIYLKSAYPNLHPKIGLIANQTQETAPWVMKLDNNPSISGSVQRLETLPDGKLMMVTSTASIYTSSDGWRWTQRRSSDGRTFADCAVGPDRIIVTTSAACLVSTDQGLTWSDGSTALKKIAYCPTSGLFVSAIRCGGTNFDVVTSPDGTNTTQRGNGSGANAAASIVSSGNTVIFAAQNGDMWRSTDGGVNWTNISLAGAGHGITTTGGPAFAIFFNGKYVFVGSARNGSNNYLFATTSDEGDTWTTGTALTLAATNGILGGKVVNGNIMMVGDSGRLTFSADGLSWSSFQLGVITTLYIMHEWGGRLFLGATSGARALNTAVQTPGAGVWVRYNPNLLDAAWNGNTLVVGGEDNLIWSSANGVEFTEQTNPGTGLSVRRIYFLNNLWIALLATTNGSIYYKSDLAFSWQSTGGAVSQLPNGAAYGAGVYVVVYNGALLRSGADLTNLTTRTSQFGSSAIMDVIFANNLFVTCGETSRIATSTDGVSWTSRTAASTPGFWRGLAYGAGVYVVVGDAGTINSSTNGTTWTNRTSNAGTNILYSVAFGGGIFVAVGANGVIVTSANGTTWTARTSPWTGGAWNRVVWAGDRFILFGEGGRVAIAWPYTYNPLTEFKMVNVPTTPESGGTTVLKFYMKT